jgi:uncharacterized protein YqjF (DUF2071 family)
MDISIKAHSPLTRIEEKLKNVLYISYLIPVEKIRKLVPDSLILSTVSGDEVFLSIVVIRNHGAHLRFAPLPRFSFNQINIRTYVKDIETGEQSVFFLKSGADFTAIHNFFENLGFPIEKISCEIDVDDSTLSYHSYGEWDIKFEIESEKSQKSVEWAPFASRQSAVEYLVLPQTGFFISKAKLWRLPVWHPPTDPVDMSLTGLKLPPFENLELVDDISKPHNVLLVPETPFYIFPGKIVEDK